MKNLLFIFFFIFCQFSFSQTDSLTFYSNKGDYQKALNYSEKLKLDKSNSNYVELITWKAELNWELGNLNEAESYYKVIENNLDSLNISYENLKFYRYEIGTCYYDNGKIKEARKNFNIHINENKDKKIERIINSIEYLAKINEEEKNFKVSDSLYLKVLNLREKEFGTKNKMYAKTLMLYAILKEKENNLNKADSLFNQAIYINNQIKNYEFKSNLFQAKLYIKFLLFKNAEISLLNILKNYNDLELIRDEVYWKSIIELVSLYAQNGRFSDAEKIIEAINFDNINPLSSKIELWDTCGILYHRLNNFEKYCHFILVANNLRIDNYKKDSPELAKGLNNVAMVYKKIGEYDKAIDYLYRAIEIHSNKNGYNNKLTGVYLKNLGDIYSELNDFNNSKKNYEIALNIFVNTLNTDQEEFISLINSLSMLYFNNNYFNKSLDLYELYLTNNVLSHFSELNPNYFITIMNYGLFLNLNSKFKEASIKFNEGLTILKKQELAILNFMSNYEYEQYNLSNYYIGLIQSFIQSHPIQFPEININCYENELLLKNLSLRNQQRIKNSIEKSNDVILKEKYQQFVANKRYLTKLEELPLAQRSTDFESLKTETESLEKDITRQSATFADAKKTLSISWKQIQEKLLPNDVVIDLVSYHYYNKKWTDSIMYGAFVIKKDSKFPKYINLFEEKQLAALLERNTMAADTIQAKILNKQYSDKAISDLFLKPLEKEFNGCKTIYLSPSGLGHQINFKALPISENQTFGEQFNIKLVGSSASIVSYKTTAFQENKSLEIILYGGIDYAKSSVTIPTNETNEVAVRSNFEGGFGYLKGTLAEISSIANQVKTNKYNAILKTERNATEESIKQLDSKKEPFVLHLATHGYFFPNPKQEHQKEDLLSESKFKIYKTADDPMMRSGLLFAGANKYWGKPIENLTTDDGILTASEISNLDLSSCQLVVMSACETGLGQINGSEGVFGLQRAFKMAGVKNIIMSLWKVPDAQTAELFDIFYTECFAGKTIHEAFQIAQSKMKIKYSPYYWAGFMLLE